MEAIEASVEVFDLRQGLVGTPEPSGEKLLIRSRSSQSQCMSQLQSIGRSQKHLGEPEAGNKLFLRPSCSRRLSNCEYKC